MAKAAPKRNRRSLNAQQQWQPQLVWLDLDDGAADAIVLAVATALPWATGQRLFGTAGQIELSLLNDADVERLNETCVLDDDGQSLTLGYDPPLEPGRYRLFIEPFIGDLRTKQGGYIAPQVMVIWVPGTLAPNANVPADAGISPAQSFVDGFIQMIGNGTSDVNFAELGMHTLTSPFVGAVLAWAVKFSNNGLEPAEVNFFGNDLQTVSVNQILTTFDSGKAAFLADGILTLSGGTNGAPAGAGVTAKNSLIAAGWTVITN